MFVWAKVPQGQTGTGLSDYLLYEKNIFATPGIVFGSNGEKYIFMSLYIHEEALAEVLKDCPKMENKVCVIGLGLIGGSIALACKNRMGFTVVGRDLLLPICKRY